MEVGYPGKAKSFAEKRLRHLSSELLRAQEEERKRIALDLHDIGTGRYLKSCGWESNDAEQIDRMVPQVTRTKS
jgi:signal transduction histidine kinase